MSFIMKTQAFLKMFYWLFMNTYIYLTQNDFIFNKFLDHHRCMSQKQNLPNYDHTGV